MIRQNEDVTQPDDQRGPSFYDSVPTASINRPFSSEEFRLQGSFESIRKLLLTQQMTHRLEKPLGYWVLPKDRGLPFVFLGWTVGKLISTPFNQLVATPGIGPKKLQTLINLLERAAQEEAPCQLQNSIQQHYSIWGGSHDQFQQGFDPEMVSETQWLKWRETVLRFRLGSEKLGRLAPTLMSLPSKIWYSKFSDYANLSLAELRRMKGHGEKRVSGVMAVFFEVYKILSRIDPDGSLGLRLASKQILAVEAWMAEAQGAADLPTANEILQYLATPLVEQIRIDAGATMEQLVEARLGIRAAPKSVYQLAQQLHTSRPRIYQHFEECNRIMKVRWPAGDDQLASLVDRLSHHSSDIVSVALLNAMHGLFYQR